MGLLCQEDRNRDVIIESEQLPALVPRVHGPHVEIEIVVAIVDKGVNVLIIGNHLYDVHDFDKNH